MPDPFLMIAAAMFPDGGVPKADAEDSMAGATIIPSEVTRVRRTGLNVTFVQKGNIKQWHWTLPNGEKIYHP